ncbi:MAG: hypothetical protein ACKVS8_02200 [Phycisphaerales bacterium]
MARTFRNLEFGPVQARAALRAQMVRGERMVGWATAQEEWPLSTALLRLGLMVLPGAGYVMSMVLGSVYAPKRMLMVLTDERLVMLNASRTGEVEVVESVEIGELSVRTGRLGITFDVGRGSEAIGRLTIDAHQSPAATRLHGALVLLAKDEAASKAGERANVREVS